ncbi:MAG: PepSY-associated TM helix domain-containing protein [Pseudomonadota bacterium]|nr:PepSY-associated TM helix domain-containing protein [Pseudomonadota bacterium]
MASKFKNWLHPLHNGSIGDQPLRILWVLSGVATALLFALGLFRWLIKTKRFKYTIS